MCNVRNIDRLVVALDEPELAGKKPLAQLVNKWATLRLQVFVI